jgi:hypothetical protein
MDLETLSGNTQNGDLETNLSIILHPTREEIRHHDGNVVIVPMVREFLLGYGRLALYE